MLIGGFSAVANGGDFGDFLKGAIIGGGTSFVGGAIAQGVSGAVSSAIYSGPATLMDAIYQGQGVAYNAALQSAANFLGPAAGGAVSGMFGAVVSGGNIEKAGLAGLVTGGLGSRCKGLLASAINGGLSSAIQGGDFGQGFVNGLGGDVISSMLSSSLQTSNPDDIKDFEKFIYEMTGYEVKINGNGQLEVLGKRNTKIGDVKTAEFLKEASELHIQITIVKNDPSTFVDWFVKQGKVDIDIGDLRSMQAKAGNLFAAAKLTHILSEQVYSLKKCSSFTKTQAYKKSHSYATLQESSILGANYRENNNIFNLGAGDELRYKYYGIPRCVVAEYAFTLDENLTPR